MSSNRQDELARLLEASAELFDVRDASCVTVREVAERADICPSTVRRFAGTKAELLVMVYNRRFAQAVEDGWKVQSQQRGLRCRLLALLTAVIECSRRQVENGRAYLDEISRGSPEERHHVEALAIVRELLDEIERIVLYTWGADQDAAPAHARLVLAVLFLELSDAANADLGVEALIADIDGLLATHFPDWIA